MKQQGCFITFEGPEKSGKSTQAQLLSSYLKEKGYDVLFVREPGSTVIGEKVRQLLLDREHDAMSHEAELCLYMAARAQLVTEVIRPALEKGSIVLCDRFSDSTLAYQGYGLGLDLEVIKKVDLVATGGLTPDLTLLLDFWGSQEFLRNSRVHDRIEMRSDSFHKRVKEGYFTLAINDADRIKVVEVQESIDQTQQLIRQRIEECLLKKSPAKKAR